YYSRRIMYEVGPRRGRANGTRGGTTMAITRMLVLRCSKRSRALDDLVEEAWLLEHHNAMLARDAEDLVEECLQVNNLAVRTWDRLLDAIREKGSRHLAYHPRC